MTLEERLTQDIGAAMKAREATRVSALRMAKAALMNASIAKGRALQVASDPARVVRDGVPYPRPVNRWTWYADDRVRWRLQP